MAIRVMSQNVMCWQSGTESLFKNRRPLIRKAVTGADVIGFQEVTPYWRECFEEDLTEYDSILVYRGINDYEATPIYWNAARFEKRDCGYFWLSETPEEESIGWGACCRRIVCWVLLYDKVDDCEFVFVNTHLDHVSEKARINGIKLICEFIRTKFGPDIPLILTGDFNAKPGSPTIQTADSLLTDARTACGIKNFETTFHGFGKEPECCIDYIYLSCMIRCVKFEIVKETDGDTVQSDHYGICATVELR